MRKVYKYQAAFFALPPCGPPATGIGRVSKKILVEVIGVADVH